MFVTCKYCGIVPRDHNCKNKPTKKKDTKASSFRNQRKWKEKSQRVKQRDKFLCQICLQEKYNTMKKYNFDSLEVHHIEPISENYDRRLDSTNLVTLCSYHHKMADKGEIPRGELFQIVEENELLFIEEQIEQRMK